MSEDRVEAIACPACGGPGCEQCEGAGWVWRVPNHLGEEEVERQISERLRRAEASG